jgi:c-di-AMP phosphodiesterase-like protein
MVLVFAAYFCEKRLKTEYIKNKHNEELHRDVKQILEQLPIGIVVYNAQSREISLSNKELKRIFREGLESSNSDIS